MTYNVFGGTLNLAQSINQTVAFMVNTQLHTSKFDATTSHGVVKHMSARSLQPGAVTLSMTFSMSSCLCCCCDQDSEYYNSLMWIMENDPECLYLTFSVDEEVFGMVGVI